MAAGADPGGNLGPLCPLSLDAYHDGMFCENMPPFVSLAFLLRRDFSPLDALLLEHIQKDPQIKKGPRENGALVIPVGQD
jgi:hypothetical protein